MPIDQAATLPDDVFETSDMKLPPGASVNTNGQVPHFTCLPNTAARSNQTPGCMIVGMFRG